MSILDDKFKNIAHSMLDKFGKDIVYTSILKAEYDVDNSSVTSPRISFNIKSSPPTNIKVYKNNENIVYTEMELLLDTISLSSVNIGDEITFDGKTYTITGYTSIYSGSLICAHKVTVCG